MLETPAAIDAMVAHVFTDEGLRYTDRPDDAGGPTCCGISLKFAKSVKLDLNHDGVTDAEDIKLVTPDIARQLILTHFYYAPKVNTLPEFVQPMMFDEIVNFGPFHAIQCLQRAVLMKPIGYIEDQTRELLVSLTTRLGQKAVVDRVVDEFIAEYKRIVAANPHQEANLKGWENRANRFRLP